MEFEAERTVVSLAVDGGRVWITGIPRREELARFEQVLLDRGVSLEEVSWRS